MKEQAEVISGLRPCCLASCPHLLMGRLLTSRSFAVVLHRIYLLCFHALWLGVSSWVRIVPEILLPEILGGPSLLPTVFDSSCG